MQLFHGEIVMADPKTCAVWICAFWDLVAVSVGNVQVKAAINPADRQDSVFALLH